MVQFQLHSLCSVKWQDNCMNDELEKMWKAQKTCEDIQFLGWDLIFRTSVHEAGVLTYFNVILGEEPTP
jgi:hypothetical protein